ncbi:alpha/beta hydrolase [Pedobacter sp. NJ-S-72]
MKKIITATFLTVFTLAVCAQEKVRPLLPKEVSERLIPQFKLAAFWPVTVLNMENIQDVRKKEKARPIPKLTNADSVEVTYKSIPGLNPGDPEIPVRIYKSKQLAKAPIIIMFHGGGFIYGDLNSDHQMCANTAIRGGVVVISVEYRLAPENIYPAGANDGYAALLWGVKHAGEIGGDPAHIAVGGGSAGAGIAGSVVLTAREKKGPKIDLQVLLFPPGDLDTTRVSVIEYYNIPGVKGADITPLMKMYLGADNVKNGLIPEYSLPGLAKDLKGLPPPTYLVTCGADPLRDGGLAYGQRLIEAGIAVELHNYPGYPHGMLPGRFYNEFYSVLKQYLK